MLLGAVESAQLEIGPVDVVAEDGDGERVDGGRDEHFATGTVQVGAFDLLQHRVGPVEHVVVVVDGQSAGLRQFRADDRLFHRTGHRRAEDLAVRTESESITPLLLINRYPVDSSLIQSIFIDLQFS